MEEIWKDIDWIEGFKGYYQISNLGNVKSLERKVYRSDGVVQVRKERVMDKRIGTDGYYIAKLNVNGISKSIAVHILVAKAFIPNPNNLPEVNHKDCCRTNNTVDNLEWTTHKDNVKYSAVLGHYKHYGESNPNYGNHVLAERYKDKALAKEVLSRPRGQNGHAKKIKAYNDNESYIFDCITDCAEWLINNLELTVKLESLRGRIGLLLNSGKLYKGFTYETI